MTEMFVIGFILLVGAVLFVGWHAHNLTWGAYSWINDIKSRFDDDFMKLSDNYPRESLWLRVEFVAQLNNLGETTIARYLTLFRDPAQLFTGDIKSIYDKGINAYIDYLDCSNPNAGPQQANTVIDLPENQTHSINKVHYEELKMDDFSLISGLSDSDDGYHLVNCLQHIVMTMDDNELPDNQRDHMILYYWLYDGGDPPHNRKFELTMEIYGHKKAFEYYVDEAKTCYNTTDTWNTVVYPYLCGVNYDENQFAEDYRYNKDSLRNWKNTGKFISRNEWEKKHARKVINQERNNIESPFELAYID